MPVFLPQPEILQRLSVATTDKDSLPDDSFFEQLMKMQVVGEYDAPLQFEDIV